MRRSLGLGMVVAGAVIGVSGGSALAVFNEGPLREVGPFISSQATPAPGGGWTAADDRTLGQSIDGQEGWKANAFAGKYDNEITSTAAHSGTQSWRFSNWFHTGLVQAFQTPNVAVTGESIDAGSHHEACSQLMGQAEQLVDVALPISDVDAASGIVDQGRRLPQVQRMNPLPSSRC